MPVAVIATALMAAGCTISQTGSVAAIDVLSPLPGAMGVRPVDQRSIDEVVAAGCGAGLITKAGCARHTQASKTRLSELKAGH